MLGWWEKVVVSLWFWLRLVCMFCSRLMMFGCVVDVFRLVRVCRMGMLVFCSV